MLFPSFRETFCNADTGIDDGAVKYHICFPFRLEDLKRVEAELEEDVESGLKPEGSFGGGARGRVDCFEGSEGVGFLVGAVSLRCFKGYRFGG